MMSKLHELYKDGFAVMRSSHRLVFIGLLTIIFPVLFLTVFNTFLDAARSNTETAEKQLLSGFHDTIEAYSVAGVSSEEMKVFVEESLTRLQHVSGVSLYRKTGSEFEIAFSYGGDGQYEASQIEVLYSLSAAGNGESVLVKEGSEREGNWLAVRTIESNGEEFLIVSYHSFSLFEQVFATREQKAYLLLSVIFAFLIVLAYWHGRQIDWHTRYNVL